MQKVPAAFFLPENLLCDDCLPAGVQATQELQNAHTMEKNKLLARIQELEQQQKTTVSTAACSVWEPDSWVDWTTTERYVSHALGACRESVKAVGVGAAGTRGRAAL